MHGKEGCLSSEKSLILSREYAFLLQASLHLSSGDVNLNAPVGQSMAQEKEKEK